MSAEDRRPALVAVLGLCRLGPGPPVLRLVDAWLDGWPSMGLVAAGMARQGYDLKLTQYADRGWRATFCTTGMEQSPTEASGTVFEATPWGATQRAAWAAVRP